MFMKGVSLGGSDPRSRLLFCQILVSRLHYICKKFSFFCNFPCPARLHFLFSWHNNLTFTCQAYKKSAIPHHAQTPMRPTMKCPIFFLFQWNLLFLQRFSVHIKIKGFYQHFWSPSKPCQRKLIVYMHLKKAKTTSYNIKVLDSTCIVVLFFFLNLTCSRLIPYWFCALYQGFM